MIQQKEAAFCQRIQNKERIQALTAALSEYAHAYYVLDAPVVSDYEYDMLCASSRGSRMAHPEFADRIRRQAGRRRNREGFEEVRHAVAMESLQDAFDEDEVTAFGERVRRRAGGDGRLYCRAENRRAERVASSTRTAYSCAAVRAATVSWAKT